MKLQSLLDRMQDSAESMDGASTELREVAAKLDRIKLAPPTEVKAGNVTVHPPAVNVTVEPAQLNLTQKPVAWTFEVTKRDNNGRIKTFTATPTT